MTVDDAEADDKELIKMTVDDAEADDKELIKMPVDEAEAVDTCVDGVIFEENGMYFFKWKGGECGYGSRADAEAGLLDTEISEEPFDHAGNLRSRIFHCICGWLWMGCVVAACRMLVYAEHGDYYYDPNAECRNPDGQIKTPNYGRECSTT